MTETLIQTGLIRQLTLLMGKEHKNGPLGIPIARVFPGAYASVYFGDINDIPLDRAANDPFFHEFMVVKNIMLKLAILFGQRNGISVNLRGSTLDQFLIAYATGNQDTLFQLKKRVNMTRGIIAAGSFIAPMDQGFDDIHDPGNPDIRFGTYGGDVEVALKEFEHFITENISPARINTEKETFPSARVVKREGTESPYLEAWRQKRPKIKRQLTFAMRADGAVMPILRYNIIDEALGAPDKKDIIGTVSVSDIVRLGRLDPDDFITTAHELGSISFTGNSDNDRRREGRCFNLDALIAEMKLPISKLQLDKLSLDELGHMQVYLVLPEIPEVLSLPQDAINYYVGEFKQGNPDIIDTWFEAVIRGIRKAVNLGVHQYDPCSIAYARRLCNLAAMRWNNVTHDTHTLIKNFRELEVACTANNDQAQNLLDITGVRPLFQLAYNQYSRAEQKAVDIALMKRLIENKPTLR